MLAKQNFTNWELSINIKMWHKYLTLIDHNTTTPEATTTITKLERERHKERERVCVCV